MVPKGLGTNHKRMPPRSQCECSALSRSYHGPVTLIVDLFIWSIESCDVIAVYVGHQDCLLECLDSLQIITAKEVGERLFPRLIKAFGGPRETLLHTPSTPTDPPLDHG